MLTGQWEIDHYRTDWVVEYQLPSRYSTDPVNGKPTRTYLVRMRVICGMLEMSRWAVREDVAGVHMDMHMDRRTHRRGRLGYSCRRRDGSRLRPYRDTHAVSAASSNKPELRLSNSVTHLAEVLPLRRDFGFAAAISRLNLDTRDTAHLCGTYSLVRPTSTFPSVSNTPNTTPSAPASLNARISASITRISASEYRKSPVLGRIITCRMPNRSTFSVNHQVPIHTRIPSPRRAREHAP